MDVTPIVQVLEAMPDGPTINLINIEGDVNLGDFNSPFARDFAKFGNLNAPFGQDFMDNNIVHDESTTFGVSNKSNAPGGTTNKVNIESIFPKLPLPGMGENSGAPVSTGPAAPAGPEQTNAEALTEKTQAANDSSEATTGA